MFRLDKRLFLDCRVHGLFHFPGVAGCGSPGGGQLQLPHIPVGVGTFLNLLRSYGQDDPDLALGIVMMAAGPGQQQGVAWAILAEIGQESEQIDGKGCSRRSRDAAVSRFMAEFPSEGFWSVGR